MIADEVDPHAGVDDNLPARLSSRSIQATELRIAFCRRDRVTIRRTLDCLIAVCIRECRPLPHADADLDRLARHSDLRVVTA